MKKECEQPPSRFSQTAITLIAVWALISPKTAVGQPPRNSVLAGESLVGAGITLSVAEQTIGELLPQLLPKARGRQVARGGQLSPIRSLWFDRQVDREARVSLTEAATPAAKVILKVAAGNELAVFPLPGVLIVGRPEWVDATVSHLTARESALDDLISIQWPTGSTAAEVLTLMLAAPASSPSGNLMTDWASVVAADGTLSHPVPAWVPHDIWASGTLIGVDRTLAVELLLAQFQCALRPGTPLQTLAGTRAASLSTDDLGDSASPPEGVLDWSAVSPAKPFLLAYPAGDAALPIRTALANTRPRASIRVSNQQLLINTSAENHRRAIEIYWTTAAGASSRAAMAGNESAPVFDLQLIDKPAAEVLRQLAQAAGKTFRLETGSEAAGEKLITLDAKKKTLAELAQLVAESGNFNVQWGEGEVILGAR